MELHEIESAIVVAESDVIIARANHKQISEKRDELKASIKIERDNAKQEIYELEKAFLAAKQKIEEALEAKVGEAQAEWTRTHEEQWEAQRAIVTAAQKLEDLERMRDVARRANLKASEFATLENRWDLMTAGAPWREWAKDHQISGGKKMVYEGRMILADTMGLGKTLTSVIAIDMIEAATKEASPDNPIKFGSIDD